MKIFKIKDFEQYYYCQGEIIILAETLDLAIEKLFITKMYQKRL